MGKKNFSAIKCLLQLGLRRKVESDGVPADDIVIFKIGGAGGCEYEALINISAIILILRNKPWT
jgi:hypothetical protein